MGRASHSNRWRKRLLNSTSTQGSTRSQLDRRPTAPGSSAGGRLPRVSGLPAALQPRSPGTCQSGPLPCRVRLRRGPTATGHRGHVTPLLCSSGSHSTLTRPPAPSSSPPPVVTPRGLLAPSPDVGLEHFCQRSLARTHRAPPGVSSCGRARTTGRPRPPPWPHRGPRSVPLRTGACSRLVTLLTVSGSQDGAASRPPANASAG